MTSEPRELPETHHKSNCDMNGRAQMLKTRLLLLLQVVLGLSLTLPGKSIAWTRQQAEILGIASQPRDERQVQQVVPRAPLIEGAAFWRGSQLSPAEAGDRIARRGLSSMSKNWPAKDRDKAGDRIARRGLSSERPSNLTSTQRWLSRGRRPPQFVGLESLGTGGGDIREIEPNDPVAQGVSLPVNIFGEMTFDFDVDFFAFRTFAGQQVTIEPFAARLQGSILIADIALFDANGNFLLEDAGSDVSDPLIRYTSSRDEILIAGVADLFDEGGPRFDYILNIVRGVDVDEIEPNNTPSQGLPSLPVTVFGALETKDDLDFYAFDGVAGQTLIVDVDAEVLGSKLDSQVNLRDPSTGTQLFFNDQYDGDDSRFNITLPYTGRYAVGVGSFEQTTRGFYRLNLSLVPGTGAPSISGVTKVSKKFIDVAGAGFIADSIVEVNGVQRPTSLGEGGALRGRIKIRPGDVVTVSNLPEDRRSNPVIFQ